jgi:hypothetical protein
MEKELKGLFGGGEAGTAPSAPAAPGAAQPPRAAREAGGRRGGGGRRRRRFNPAEDAQAQDFVQRYTTGHPSEGFSSDEAVNYLQQLRGQVPPEVMQRAAVQTVQNLPPDQRQAFEQMLERRRAGTGMVTIERTGQAHEAQGRSGGAGNDPLGDLFGGLFGGPAAPMPQPQAGGIPGGDAGMDDMLGGLLGTLLGGGMAQPQPQGRGKAASDPFGDILGGLLGGGGMAAPAPEPEPKARQQPQAPGGGIGDLLGSPLGKAVLGGIAAYAMKEMMNQGKKG